MNQIDSLERVGESIEHLQRHWATRHGQEERQAAPTAFTIALSREAGVWEELSSVALEVNPFDLVGTADVLAAALAMDPADRAAHAGELRKLAAARSPRDWLDDQLAVADRPH